MQQSYATFEGVGAGLKTLRDLPTSCPTTRRETSQAPLTSVGPVNVCWGAEGYGIETYPLFGLDQELAPKFEVFSDVGWDVGFSVEFVFKVEIPDPA